MKRLRFFAAAAVVALICGFSSAAFAACSAAFPCTQSVYNGKATVTRPANTTAYTGLQLQANNTSGSVVPAQVTVTGANAGVTASTGYVTGGKCQTSYTGASAPPTQTWWLFSALPTVSGLIDGSAYIGPYAADVTGGIFVGALVCSSWQKTNDGTAQWFSPATTSNTVTGPLPFQAVSSQVYLDVLLETNGAYTPLSGEVETLLVNTARDN